MMFLGEKCKLPQRELQQGPKILKNRRALIYQNKAQQDFGINLINLETTKRARKTHSIIPKLEIFVLIYERYEAILKRI